MSVFYTSALMGITKIDVRRTSLRRSDIVMILRSAGVFTLVPLGFDAVTAVCESEPTTLCNKDLI